MVDCVNVRSCDAIAARHESHVTDGVGISSPNPYQRSSATHQARCPLGIMGVTGGEIRPGPASQSPDYWGGKITYAVTDTFDYRFVESVTAILH
ncbi:hypothetical protein DP49_4396 [Burkholderia pseudomallei]|nr:hypothetical protein DP49_4396 [Burkholderia pseudomallei]